MIQLQAFLVARKYLTNASRSAFDAATRSAGRSWQRQEGVTADGVVRASDLVFVPTLPANVIVDPSIISRGAILRGGEPAIASLPASPDFTLDVGQDQAQSIADGTEVEITSPTGSTWRAIVQSRVPSQNQDEILKLGSKTASPICVAECSKVPASGSILLPSRVVIAASVSGLVVPTSAIVSAPDGTVFVVDARGLRHPVVIVSSANGSAVVTGVREGTHVRVPAAGS